MNQIALSVGDRQVSREFYRGLFGLPQVGGTHFQGKVTEKVQGLPGASSDVYWHMDDREFFQLELFQFECPVPRPYAALRKPWDIGYSRLAIEVTDPVRLHAICRERSVPGLAPVKSVRGKPHFVLRDPNGVLVEVGPASRLLGAHVGARLAGVGMSVPNLDVAVNSFQCVIGCPVLDASPVDKGALCLPPRTRRPQRPPRHPRGRPSSLRRLSSWSHPSPSTQIPCWPRC
jgi:catechol 2,3-dioxygenase-like lactoylglutathione lyase family enzyme